MSSCFIIKLAKIVRYGYYYKLVIYYLQNPVFELSYQNYLQKIIFIKTS